MSADNLAANGAALIKGQVVPPAEVRTLFALITLRGPASVAEIARQATRLEPQRPISQPSAYSLLKRLGQRGGLVSRAETQVPMQMPDGRLIGYTSRILWTPSQHAVSFFNELVAKENIGENIKENRGEKAGQPVALSKSAPRLGQ